MAKIYYRSSLTPTDEIEAIGKYFPGSKTVPTGFDYGDLVIGRYSVLPFYKDQERTLKEQGQRLINSTLNHLYISQSQYIKDLGKWTSRTWWSPEEMMSDKCYTGPYVVKGVTNSKKFNWSTHMFAKDKAAAMDVYCRLQQDSLIGEQQIIFKEFLKFEVLDQSVGDAPPIINEWRVFVLRSEIVAQGFYWASYPEAQMQAVAPDPAFLQTVISRINVPFYAVDVARDVDGKWWVVEVNDGQMSGLSTIDPDQFYKRLAERADPCCFGD